MFNYKLAVNTVAPQQQANALVMFLWILFYVKAL